MRRLLGAVRRRTAGTGSGEDGQIMLLSIAFAVLALLLVTAIVSATSIHLERKRLLALADLAVLDAADALDTDLYYSGSGDDVLPVTDRSVRASVAAYLDAAPGSDRFTDLTLVEATVVDGGTAEVSLRSLARPPILTWITAPWSDGIALTVTTRATTS